MTKLFEKIGLFVIVISSICFALLFCAAHFLDNNYPIDKDIEDTSKIINNNEIIYDTEDKDKELMEETTINQISDNSNNRQTINKNSNHINNIETSSSVDVANNNSVERIFVLHNITIDATQCSAFDDIILYVKDIIKELPHTLLFSRLETIYLVDNIDVYGAGESAVGLVYGKEMYIETKLQTKQDLKSTIYHELGHFADDSLHLGTAYYSLSTEWKNLIAEEGHALCKQYGRDILDSEYHSAREGFAMAIEAYFLKSINGQSFNLKNECPKIYTQIHKMISSKYVVMMWNDCEYFYFNNYNELVNWVNKKYEDSASSVINNLNDWLKYANVGDVLNCQYGFNIQKRN